MTLLIVGAVVLVGALVALVLSRRRPGSDPGLATFQRHISALSPEARRAVLDRARQSDHQQRRRSGN